MKSGMRAEEPLSSSYCPVYFAAGKNSEFMFGGGPFLMTRKIQIYLGKITFGRRPLFFKPGFALRKEDIDAIELFRPTLKPVKDIRISHHNKQIFSPIIIEQYDEDLEVLRQAGYPVTVQSN
jgi:hypothetical protein